MRCAGLNPLNEIVNGRVNEVQAALFVDIEGRLGRAFLKESAHILHEFSIIEVDADRPL